MKTRMLCRSFLLAALSLAGALPMVQAASVKFQAESGTLGSDLLTGTDAGGVAYLYYTVDGAGNFPTAASRVATYSVTFPQSGSYDLYARIYVGPAGGGANDDSFFIGNSFGTKALANNNWLNANGLNVGGFTASDALVTGGGSAGTQVWKWINLSKFTGVSYTVPAGSLTQTLQIGSRENGLFIDAFVFGQSALVYTVADLDAGAPGSPPPPVDVAVDYNNTFQQLDGFGGAAVYDCEQLIIHPKRQEIYDLLFRDLGLEILRIRNTYGHADNGAALNATAQIVAEARKPGNNPNLKTFLVPWSPPAYLKSNNDINNGGTLKGAPNAYIYAEYAQWWADSIRAWRAAGVDPDFVSIQNEPDQTVTYDSFRLAPTETTTMAGYDKAFNAVVTKFEADFGFSRPEMWGAEHSGMNGNRAFITALNNAGLLPKLDGIAFHPYGEGNYDNPDASSFANQQNGYYNDYVLGLGKPVHMTEYVKLNTTPDFGMGWRFAWHIHNFLYKAHVTSYFNWTLFRGPNPAGGGIVTMTSATDYTIRPQYWFLKAYTRFTDADWWLLGTQVTGLSAPSVKVSAFKNPDGDELTVVLLNTSTTGALEVGNVNVANFSPSFVEVFRSSETEQWVNRGAYSPAMTLPPTSITTVHMLSGQKAVQRQVEVIRGGYSLNRRTNKVTQQVTLKNTSPNAVSGPIRLALDNLSANTALSNAAGTTANLAPLGSPYVTVSNATLAPGASVSVVLEFTPPASGGVTYTPRVIANATP